MKNSNIILNNNAKAEVLAPAGSIDIAKAVINAGADAVYLGGDMFGARAYAGNLNPEEMLEIIEYAHRYGKKIYLTVNTLLKEQEITKSLVDYLIPYYEKGLDAVIVQDLGVFNLIHKNFPDMDIHASTQMTQTGPKGSKILQELGAKRVVTSREMSLEEIRTLHKEIPELEIESFVHGALCYCYSGQCLLSSFNGGRSGNRGRCAQPCRMPYEVDYNNEIINRKDERYILSPKDMCGLSILPDIIEAGVYSLKIEGRMKNVTYAAFVTSMYRKYLDMYFEKGRKGFKVEEKDINDLLDIYNRGMFTTGYYNASKGKEMLSLNRPNHMGTKGLKVISNQSGRVKFKALEEINPGDVFEIEEGASFTSGKALKANEELVVNLPKKYKLNPGRVVNRMNNAALKTLVQDNFVNNEPKLDLDLNIYVSVNENAVLTASLKNPNYGNSYYGKGEEERVSEYIDVSVTGDLVQEAKNAAIDEKSIKKALSQMGDSYFRLNNLDIYLNGNAFLPMGSIKKLRRELIEKLDYELINCKKRTFNGQNSLAFKTNSGKISKYGLSLYFTNFDLSKKIEDYSEISRVYLDFSSLYKISSKLKDEEELEKIKHEIERIKAFGCDFYLSLPYIYKISHKNTFRKLVETAINLGVNAFLIRNLEELRTVDELIDELGLGVYENADARFKFVFDSNMYCFNKFAKEELEKIRVKNLKLSGFSAPLELNNRELADVLDPDFELQAVYRAPLMVSEQCHKKAFDKCNKKMENYTIRNGKNKDYQVKSVCPFCYMQMDSKMINLLDTKEIKELNYGHLRIQLEKEEDLLAIFDALEINEDNSETLDQMKKSIRISKNLVRDKNEIVEYGHFYRGVE